MMQETEINAFSIDRSEAALRERLELSLWRIENLEYDIHERARGYFETEASLLLGRIRGCGDDPKAAEPEDPFLCREYSRNIFGGELGDLMSAWSYELLRLSEPSACRDTAKAAAAAETFIQIYNAFEEAYGEAKEGLPKAEHIKDIIYSYIYDYLESFISGYLRGAHEEGIVETGLFTAGLSEAAEETEKEVREEAPGEEKNEAGKEAPGEEKKEAGKEAPGEDEGELRRMASKRKQHIRVLHANDLSLFLGDRLGARILDLLRNELRSLKKEKREPVLKEAFGKVPEEAGLSYSERQQRILTKIRTGFLNEPQGIKE